MPVVTAAIAVERTEQPAPVNNLAHALETGERAFLGDEKHGVMLAGRIVHRHDEVPDLARHPLMRAAVLVQHHARPRRAFPALAVGAAPGGLRRPPGGPERGLRTNG